MSGCFPKKSDIEAIKALEAELHIKLPKVYVEFLLNPPENNGERSFSIPPDGSSTLRTLFSTNSDPSLFDAAARSQNELPEGLVYIGSDIGDNWLCLDTQKHHVFWIDHESLEMTCIKSSFSEFMGGLIEPLKPAEDPIELACKEGTKSDIIKLLSGAGSAVRTNFGRTIAQETARQGNLELLVLCRELGQDLKGCIHLAAMNDKSDAVKYLVTKAGIDVNEVNDQGWKPLQCVLFDDELRNWLIQRGAI